MNEKTLEKILNIFLNEVLPLTEKGVEKGAEKTCVFFRRDHKKAVQHQ